MQWSTVRVSSALALLSAAAATLEATTSSLKSTAKLSLVAVGDWGGDSDDHPATEEQVHIAGGMNKVAAKTGSNKVLMLGDNFYSHGVDQCESPRFKETFEDVYGVQDSLKDLPFYVIAGNHDWRSSVEAQIAYSNISSRWRFPATHYVVQDSFKKATGDTATVDFIFIDTVQLCGNSHDEHGQKLTGEHLPGPSNSDVAADQWAWLERQLKSSTADFLWVAGHFPIYSVGADGTTPLLVKKLLPLLKQYGAHYLSGHDHMMQHLRYDGVEMVLAGAGKECCYSDTHLATVPKEAVQFYISGRSGRGRGAGKRKYSRHVRGGFAGFEFFDDSVSMTLYTQDGHVLYEAPPISSRPKVAALEPILSI